MSRLNRFPLGAMALVFSSMLGATTARATTLSSSPLICTVAIGQTQCSVLMSWDSAGTGAAQAQIWVKTNGGGSETFFACGVSGSQNATLTAGSIYDFTLYQSLDCTPATKGAPLDMFHTYGTSPAPTVNPQTVNVPYNTTKTITLTGSDPNNMLPLIWILESL